MSSDLLTKVVAAVVGAAVLALQGFNINEANTAIQEIHELHAAITTALQRQQQIIDYIQKQKGQ